jgi:hypothetical protein
VGGGRQKLDEADERLSILHSRTVYGQDLVSEREKRVRFPYPNHPFPAPRLVNRVDRGEIATDGKTRKGE